MNAQAGAQLVPRMTRQGIEVDIGDDPEGVWFEKGEILFFARDRHRFSKKLAAASVETRPSERISPRSGRPMAAFELDVAGTVYKCRHTGGLWFDRPVLEALASASDGIRFELVETPQPAASAPGGAVLRPLPNLALSSAGTLFGLYAILGLVLIAAVEFFAAPLWIVLAFGVGVSFLHFALGPWLMDLSLNFLYRIQWVGLSDMPEHLQQFVTALSETQGIKPPRFGLLDDGAPQAFTYGHTPNNARIVLSRGTLELLEPAEIEAVVAHEVGHAVRWDMFLMTVAQLVPLLLYYVYRALARSRSSGSGKKNSLRPLLMAGAYLLYIVSQYVVLWFSRTRELHADRFAGEVTGRPAALSSALVKIAYGLAGREPPAKESDAGEAEARRSPRLEAVKALGIFDAGTARNLVMAAHGGTTPGDTGSGWGVIDPTALKSAMRWDMWNPWARWYELNSTHPLTARRLHHLSNQSEAMGQAPFVRFDLEKPESYWDEFLVDFLVQLLPTMAMLAVLAAGLLLPFVEAGGEPPAIDADRLVGAFGLAVGVAFLLRLSFVYASSGFEGMTVAALLKKVKVSAVRPVPCILQGKVIGRGVPGLIYSEDFVLRDATGIIFLDVRQPLRVWEFFFGLLKAGRFDGREVAVEGWYRRAPVPYVEVRRIICDGETTRSWLPMVNVALASLLGAIGIAALLLRPFERGILPNVFG